MKKFLIAYIAFCLVTLYAVLLYSLAFDLTSWFDTQEREVSDFLYFKKEDIVALLLVMLSITGILVRERNGWILTTQLFYALLGGSVTFILKLNSSMQLLIFLAMVLVLIPPLFVMNSKTIQEFYRMDDPQNKLLNNAMALLIAVLASILVW